VVLPVHFFNCQIMKLPTQQQCLAYFKEYRVPKNIRQHCLKVQEVAVFLAEQLQRAGISIDIGLVRSGSILHDLFKMAGIKNPEPNQHHQVQFSPEELAMREKLITKFPGKHETQIAYEIFKDEFPELALVLLHEGDHYFLDKSLEESLITYADYRIFKDQIVSLEERFAYFAAVYSIKNDLWELALEHIRKVERELFASLDFAPQQLAEALKSGQADKNLTTITTKNGP